MELYYYFYNYLNRASATITHSIIVVPGDQLRLGSRGRKRRHGERRRDGQLSAYTRRSASGFGQVLMQPVERGRFQRGRARLKR